MFAQFEKIEEPRKLGGAVNTSSEEIFPVFLKSDGSLYFTRTFDENSTYGPTDQNIWKSEKEGDFTYKLGKNMDVINNKFNNCIIGFNSDETRIYLLNAYEGKKDLKKGICFSEKKGENWTKPKEIKIPGLDIDGDFYSFHINREENAIIISYFGPNSEGEEDLYICLLENEKWSAPKSMGDVINSKGFEISPFLSQNNDTLYFSSNGFGGEGDSDIFYAIRKNNSWFDWSEPINISNKINSPKFDAYFTMSNGIFYWSSNRDAKRSDIYYSKFLSPPKLKATAEWSDVTFYKGSDGKINLTVTDGVAPYSFQWSNGLTIEDPKNLYKGIYEVIVSDAIGQNVSLTISINEPDNQVLDKKEVTLPKADIYFDLDKSSLNKQNLKDLDNFISEMKKTPASNVKITIVSHCDKRQTDKYNMLLSRKRMETTIEYLTKNGLDRKYLFGEYKGERDPKVKCNNCTEEEFTKNRRTTIRVTHN